MTLNGTSVNTHFVAACVLLSRQIHFQNTISFPARNAKHCDQIVKDTGDDPRGTHAGPPVVSTTLSCALTRNGLRTCTCESIVTE